MSKPPTTAQMTSMWVIAALAFLSWCSFLGWTWVTFYEYSGAARGFLVGANIVLCVLLFFYLVICVFAMDEWSDAHDVS